jgi:formylglycine-generating enzyme required for sulfatase activity
MKYVKRIARSHGALILLDGLDECGTSATRERVLGAVRELMRTAGPKCRFLLTARPYAWPGGPDPARGVYALADLNDGQIEQFIRIWYAALVTRAWLPRGEAERKMEDLLAARQRPDLLPLAGNPLLLTLMATLHANRGRLPDDRADLYNESVDLLMLRWNRQIGADKALLDELAIPSLKLSDLREVLEELAFKVHEDSLVEGAQAQEAGTDASGGDGTADIGEDRLVRAFMPLFNKDRNKAAVVVDYIEKRAGLLIGQGEKRAEPQFAFPHRTFQEFLAACHLAAQDDLPAECARLARAAAGHWQVVLPLAARLAKVERGASAADEMIGGISIEDFRSQRQPDAGDWTCALLAGTQLQEIGIGAVHKRPRTRAIAARVADWIAASLPVHPDEGGAPAQQRAYAGDVLAALGDPRFDAERFHLPADDMLGFVRIPADPEFKIGTRKADAKRVSEIIGADVPDKEINDVPTPTAEFYITRYPVTVAQYRAFVESTEFEIGDADALCDPHSRPVRYVSWHEARAYCEWLHEMLATSPLLEHGDIVRLVRDHGWRVGLPNELEWEKAARGGLRDAVYSWGDTPDPERANYTDSEIGDTSAVGCFPANGCGLHDMIGNVWEWTRSKLAPYPYRADDGRELQKPTEDDWMVLRGGSWSDSSGGARCAGRDGLPPDYRNVSIGFRVVLRSAPVR